MTGTDSDTFLLFVYGTLGRGGCRHSALAGQTYRGEARTRPLYALYDLDNYPGLKVVGTGGQVVHGELYAVENGLRARLDEIEGSPDWFALAPIELDGITESVWAYFYARDPGPRRRIESGRWENP